MRESEMLVPVLDILLVTSPTGLILPSTFGFLALVASLQLGQYMSL